MKKWGKQSFRLSAPPSVAASACIVGKKEGEGPLANRFDAICRDPYFGQKSWEQAESELLRRTLSLAMDKAGCRAGEVDAVFAGDLQSQCTASSFALRDWRIPVFGVYGACSTMAESLALAAMTIDGGFADCCAAATSSHFCTAERQFRVPLEYGGQRPPTSQWTVTGAGAVILRTQGAPPYLTCITAGTVCDAGITDANNMGAAMAPAAYETLATHFSDTGRRPEDYDLIVTGDLGKIGHAIVSDFFEKDGCPLGKRYLDCGMLIFNGETQDTHAGGSGCGCSASVLAGHLLRGMAEGHWKKLLFCATGALMSTVSSQQGNSIPGICHAIAIETERGN